MDLDDDERRLAEKPSEAYAPRLGDSNADWKQVKAFYQYWEAFSTQRSCAVADRYDTRAAPNRQVRRAMEKENNKARAESKRKVLRRAHRCVHDGRSAERVMAWKVEWPCGGRR